MSASLGQQIVHYRKKNAISRKRLAEIVGISYDTLRHYEKDIREPNISTLMKISKILNITVDTLVGLDPLPDLIAQNSSEALALRIFRTLNDTGQSRVLEYSSLMSKSPQHTRKN